MSEDGARIRGMEDIWKHYLISKIEYYCSPLLLPSFLSFLRSFHSCCSGHLWPLGAHEPGEGRLSGRSSRLDVHRRGNPLLLHADPFHPEATTTFLSTTNSRPSPEPASRARPDRASSPTGFNFFFSSSSILLQTPALSLRSDCSSPISRHRLHSAESSFVAPGCIPHCRPKTDARLTPRPLLPLLLLLYRYEPSESPPRPCARRRCLQFSRIPPSPLY